MATWVDDRSRTSGRSCSTCAPITPSRMASPTSSGRWPPPPAPRPGCVSITSAPATPCCAPSSGTRGNVSSTLSATSCGCDPASPTPPPWTAPGLLITGPDGQPYLRMFGQLRESAEQQLWPDFRRTATTDWLGPLEDGLRSIGRPELASLVLAVIRGLLMDLDATADTTRTDRAFHDFLDAVEQLSSGDRATAGRFQERASSGTTSSGTAWDM